MTENGKEAPVAADGWDEPYAAIGFLAYLAVLDGVLVFLIALVAGAGFLVYGHTVGRLIGVGLVAFGVYVAVVVWRGPIRRIVRGPRPDESESPDERQRRRLAWLPSRRD